MQIWTKMLVVLNIKQSVMAGHQKGFRDYKGFCAGGHRMLELKESWTWNSVVHKMLNNQAPESFATCPPCFLKHMTEGSAA